MPIDSEGCYFLDAFTCIYQELSVYQVRYRPDECNIYVHIHVAGQCNSTLNYKEMKLRCSILFKFNLFYFSFSILLFILFLRKPFDIIVIFYFWLYILLCIFNQVILNLYICSVIYSFFPCDYFSTWRTTTKLCNRQHYRKVLFNFMWSTNDSNREI